MNRAKRLLRRACGRTRAWVAGEKAADWVAAISGVVTALAVVWAAIVYVADWMGDVTLTMDPPLVVELRCSRADFDTHRCLDPETRGEAHLSLTAAFRMNAEGPSSNKASVDRVTATVQFGPKENPNDPVTQKHKLQSFWSANLTPGHEDQQRQVTTLSMSGGESLSREIWFMPIPRSSDDKPAQYAVERADFLPWRDIFFEIRRRSDLTDIGTFNPDKLVRINFTVDWHGSGRKPKSFSTSCLAELGLSIRDQAKAVPDAALFPCLDGRSPESADATKPKSCQGDPRALSFTLPCRDAQPEKRPGFWPWG